MKTIRQALLSSVSHGTVVLTADLVRDLEPRGKSARRKRLSRERSRGVVMGTIGLTALAMTTMAIGVTGAPQRAAAEVCFTTYGLTGSAGPGNLACGFESYAGGAFSYHNTAVGKYATANGGPGSFLGLTFGGYNSAFGDNAFAGSTSFVGGSLYGVGLNNTATGQNAFAGAQYAYGNTATGAGSFAGANVLAVGNTATGAYSFAGTEFGATAKWNTATGSNAVAGSIFGNAYGNTATGAYSAAGSTFGNAVNNTANGYHASAGSIDGNAYGNTATGAFSSAGSTVGNAIGNTANGYHAHAGAYGYAKGNTANGAYAGAGSAFGNAANNTASGFHANAGSVFGNAYGNTASGAYAFAGGNVLTYHGHATVNNTATGYHATSYGYGNTASGAHATAIGSYNSASGTGATAEGFGSSAFGASATAIGAGNTAVGGKAHAYGTESTAVGAYATAAFDHSTAVGAGATTTTNNQMVLGTGSDTITAPGISSSLSRSRQSGPLEVVTSDAGGNLATDGGLIFNQLGRLDRRSNEAFSGVALAMASTGPDLTGNERFGVSANWGGFEGANAFGMGFEGVLWNNFLTQGGRLAVTGGFGVGFQNGNNNSIFGQHEFGSSEDTVWGGRVGAQWTWGHSPVAYAAPPPEAGPLK
jgi:hypothetical protein